MIAEGVDPRDIRWETDEPVSRVYFWDRPGPSAGVPEQPMGLSCDEYRLTGATDVGEVLAWARARARADETFALYVEHHDGDARGLIRLLGTDPNAAGPLLARVT